MQLEDIVQHAGASRRSLPTATTRGRAICWSAPTAMHSTVRARVFGGPRPSYAGYVGLARRARRAALPQVVRADLFESYGFFLPPREMLLSYCSRAPMTISARGGGA